MSSNTNRLPGGTCAMPCISLCSDSASSFAISSSELGLMRATMLDHAHLLLGVLVHVALGRLVVGGRVGLHREVLHPSHRGAAVGLLEVPLDVHELEGA